MNRKQQPVSKSPSKSPANPQSAKPPTSQPSPEIPAGWLSIGKVVSAQGLKGEVRIYPDSDFPERFEEPGERWLLRPGQAELESIELVQGRYLPGKNLYVVQFASITGRDQAEALAGSQLLVQESDRPLLEEGEFHVMDLIDLEVFDQSTQALVGTVINVLAAGNDLLEVKLSDPQNPKQTTVLIPFVEPIVPVVDLAAKRIEITPPPGLID